MPAVVPGTGPSRLDASWQARLEGGYGIGRFEIAWERKQVRCPQGKLFSAWSPLVERTGRSYIRVLFRRVDCAAWDQVIPHATTRTSHFAALAARPRSHAGKSHPL